MTDLLTQVTPLTKGILWFTSNELNVQKSFYKDIDYLLNGLLTATRNSSTDFKSHVLISENFGKSFYVLAGANVTDADIRSYFDLVANQLEGESEFLVIDESASFSKFEKLIPKALENKFRQIH